MVSVMTVNVRPCDSYPIQRPVCFYCRTTRGWDFTTQPFSGIHTIQDKLKPVVKFKPSILVCKPQNLQSNGPLSTTPSLIAVTKVASPSLAEERERRRWRKESNRFTWLGLLSKLRDMMVRFLPFIPSSSPSALLWISVFLFLFIFFIPFFF